MSRSLLNFGSLRRIFRPRRAPRPREQEWLRLILLVRRLQHGQLAFAQRLDEIRTLTVALGSFRSDIGALHEQLAAARLSAGELERGLAERLQRLDGLPDPSRERALLEQRLATLDALTGRLETLAGQAPSAGPPGRSDAVLAKLEHLAARLEAAQGPSAFGGQDELAQLYDRMLELSEGLAHRPPPVDLSDSAFARDAGARLALISQQLERLHETLTGSGSDDDEPVRGEALARIEKLVLKLERRSAGPGSAKELTALLNRFEALASRLEQVPAALPELPARSEERRVGREWRVGSDVRG